MISGAGGAISAFLMWGFAGNDLALLFAFVVVFGTAVSEIAIVTNCDNNRALSVGDFQASPLPLVLILLVCSTIIYFPDMRIYYI